MIPRNRALLLTFAIVSSSSAVVAAADPSPTGNGRFVFSSPPLRSWSSIPAATGDAETASAVARVRTIPTFQDTFAYGGQTYTYTMVGRNPRLSTRRSVVPAVIVPLRFVFADGEQFDPAKTTRQMRRSPIFRRSAFASGTTQYGDAIQRAEFSTFTQGTHYHVLLGHPAVAATQVFHVPASEGMTSMSQFGGTVGLVAESFLLEQVVPTVINRLRIPPSKLLILWSYDVALKPPGGQTGLILGEHSAGTDRTNTNIWTFTWASWNTADVVPEEDTDVAAISHEIAEWYNDPFAANAVPPWEAPPNYPCNPLLEVGDPLVGTTFVQDGYHLQDEAFLSWFAREVPSMGLDGRYSFLGTLTAPPPVCTVAPSP